MNVMHHALKLSKRQLSAGVHPIYHRSHFQIYARLSLSRYATS
jgi:hypothetical protein